MVDDSPSMASNVDTIFLGVRPGVVSALAWSRSGELLVSGGSDGALSWWDVRNRQCTPVHQGHQGTVQALMLSPDGTRLASCGDDGAIMLWDLHNRMGILCVMHPD